VLLLCERFAPFDPLELRFVAPVERVVLAPLRVAADLPVRDLVAFEREELAGFFVPLDRRAPLPALLSAMSGPSRPRKDCRAYDYPMARALTQCARNCTRSLQRRLRG
jgi:hypothetical protein